MFVFLLKIIVQMFYRLFVITHRKLSTQLLNLYFLHRQTDREIPLPNVTYNIIIQMDYNPLQIDGCECFYLAFGRI